MLIGISLSSIIGVNLAPHPSLATLPFGLVSLGALLSTYQLSVLMQQRGRRMGLRLGAMAGTLSALLCMVSIYTENFYLFCLASLLMGIYQASSVFYRLAAMDEAPEDKKGSVMGWVLSGSLLAAILGPTLARLANQWFTDPAYLGAYLFVGIFAIIAFFLLGVLSNPVVAKSVSANNTRHFLQNPAYRIGVTNTAFAQFVMMLMVLTNYYVSLFLLGIGWNFMYMSGTRQYSAAIEAGEKGKGQGIAELTIAFSSIVAVIGGGVLINWFDWQQLNDGVLVLLLGMVALNLLVQRQSSS